MFNNIKLNRQYSKIAINVVVHSLALLGLLVDSIGTAIGAIIFLVVIV